MKQNWKYFRYVHNFYILEIKKVLVLFNEISSFRLREDDSTTHILHSLQLCFPSLFLVHIFMLNGTINIEHTASTSSSYTHANIVHIRAYAYARYESNPTSLVPSYFCTLVYIFFVDFCVFLDVARHS